MALKQILSVFVFKGGNLPIANTMLQKTKHLQTTLLLSIISGTVADYVEQL
jgi:hypothetical protein